MSSTFVQTTLDYLTAFKQCNGFDVDYIHVTHNASVEFEFDNYDVIFQNYCARLCINGYVSDSYQERLRNFSGVKVLAVQDEYEYTDTLKAAIKDIRFNIVLTCVPQDNLEYVYPKSEFPDVEFITVFTGYVPDSLASGVPTPTPLAERPIFIGYRGRDIGGRFGRLGFDKFEIGRRMRELCSARGIETDIAMDEASRIYGKAWFDFVGNCRAMLGSESGSNVFDFDGSIATRFKEMTAANGGVPPSYIDFLPMVAERDSEIEMGQISPRVFECAMMRTPMVLFKGRYSDAIVPDEHYIALDKDFSNLDEVLSRLNDLPALEAMAQRAFDHLVGSERFTYRAFYAEISKAIERQIAKKGRQSADVPAAPVKSETLFDSAGLLLERPTAWPKGGEALRIRLDLADVVLYRREFNRLTAEFANLRELFKNELLRLQANYEAEWGRLVCAKAGSTTSVELSLPRFEDSASARLLASYDAEMVDMPLQSGDVRARLYSAISAEDDAAASETVRHMLELEKSAYSRMTVWISEFNAAYDADRANMQQAYNRIKDFVWNDLASKIPLQPSVGRRTGLTALELRLWRACSTILWHLVPFARARRLATAIANVELLAKRIVACLKSVRLT
jgi:hypothetical protein